MVWNEVTSTDAHAGSPQDAILLASPYRGALSLCRARFFNRILSRILVNKWGPQNYPSPTCVLASLKEEGPGSVNIHFFYAHKKMVLLRRSQIKNLEVTSKKDRRNEQNDFKRISAFVLFVIRDAFLDKL